MNTINRIDSGIRVAVAQSLTRTTPSTSFGSVVKAGLPIRNPVAETLRDVLAGVADIQMYIRMHSPTNTGLLLDLDALKARLNSVAVRAEQATPASAPTPAPTPGIRPASRRR